jgi:hypothetical protein
LFRAVPKKNKKPLKKFCSSVPRAIVQNRPTFDALRVSMGGLWKADFSGQLNALELAAPDAA